MNERLKLLIDLQELDSSILSLSEQIDILPGKMEQFKDPLKKAEAAYQKVKAKSEELDKKKKNKDLELEEIQDKVDKLKARSSEIKTNKEYEAHVKEIEGFEKNKYRIEDEILSLMEEIENSSKDMQKESLNVKKAEDEFREQEKAIEEEKKKLYAEMDKQKTNRKEFVGRVDEETYEQYMKLLKRMGGLAVVQTRNEVCLGCNTNIPPQLYNDIKKNDDLYHCFYCKRFLYYKESPPLDSKAPEAAPASS